jgi:hypothetical protein
MGTTAEIAGRITSRLKSKITDLSDIRAAEQFFQEAQIDADGVKKLALTGHDPCHALSL